MFLHVFLSLLVALFISILLINIAGRRGPGPFGGFLFFFFIFFLVTWAFGVWISPELASQRAVTRDTLSDWVLFPVIGIVIATLIVVLIPAEPLPEGERRKVIRLVKREELKKEKKYATVMSIGLAFWLFLMLMIISIAIRYLIA